MAAHSGYIIAPEKSSRIQRLRVSIGGDFRSFTAAGVVIRYREINRRWGGDA